MNYCSGKDTPKSEFPVFVSLPNTLTLDLFFFFFFYYTGESLVFISVLSKYSLTPLPHVSPVLSFYCRNMDVQGSLLPGSRDSKGLAWIVF